MPSSRVGDYIIYYENAEEFRVVRKEVFTDHVYYVELGAEEPRILDLGAYIGDTVIYFKKLYPKAKIVAVEPLPENVRLLRKNVEENQLEGVKIIEAAVTAKEGEVTIFTDKNENGWTSMTGKYEGGWGGQQESRAVKVRAISLESLLTEPVDLLKMDIEGAEEEVLRSCEKLLRKMKNIVVEFHPALGRDERGLVKLLERQGFEVGVEEDKSPLGKGLKIVRGRRES